MTYDLKDLEKIAKSQFAADRFIDAGEVCVFAEHETTNSDGDPVKFDRNGLQEIVDGCNARIADTGDFAPLTNGHLPPPEKLEDGAPAPEILGYSGPFWLGEIGGVKPRAAIFAREWHRKDKADQLEGLPRRSVEYWPSKKHFDPIAALGAVTPRLDLGMKFQARISGGEKVEIYQAAAPVRYSRDGETKQGANGNTLTLVKGRWRDLNKDTAGGGKTAKPKPKPTAKPRKKKVTIQQAAKAFAQRGDQIVRAMPWHPENDQTRYEVIVGGKKQVMTSGQIMDSINYQAAAPSGGNTFTKKEVFQMDGDNSTRELIAAIMELPAMKWVAEKMQAESAGEPTEGESQAFGAEEFEDDELDLLDDGGDLDAEVEDDDELLEARGDEDDESEDYSPLLGAIAEGAISGALANKMQNADERDKVMKFARQREAKIKSLEKQVKESADKYSAVASRMDSLIRESTDNKRKAKVTELASRYSIDEKDLLNRCLYSRGGKMTGEAFKAEVSAIEKHGTPAPPMNSVLPAGSIPGGSPADAGVQAKVDRAVKYALSEQESGRPTTFDAAMRHIESLGN